MECGSQDALCELTNWLSQNDLLAPWLVEVISRFGVQANGVAGQLAQLVRDYGQTIVGLVGVTFGFWRWWRYREHILHRRLAEYIAEKDRRLEQGTLRIIELIQRPAPGQQFKDPLFIDADLKVVLRERNWDKPAYALGVAKSSDVSLGRAIESIKRRLGIAEGDLASLRQQLASAYAIRGTIAASMAGRGTEAEMNSRALSYFRSALALPGHENDFELRELEAHQMRKLGLAGADEAYTGLCELADSLSPLRRRAISFARAKRYLSEVMRPYAPLAANQMMRSTQDAQPHFPGALKLISDQEPLEGWERLEKADMHYYTALGAHELGFVVIAPAQLADAETEYRRVATELGRRRWLRPRKFRHLRTRAHDGLRRVAAAREGNYDTSWLP